jgi:hypothetical protein
MKKDRRQGSEGLGKMSKALCQLAACLGLLKKARGEMKKARGKMTKARCQMKTGLFQMTTGLFLASEALRLRTGEVRLEPERLSEEEVGPFGAAALPPIYLTAQGAILFDGRGRFSERCQHSSGVAAQATVVEDAAQHTGFLGSVHFD